MQTLIKGLEKEVADKKQQLLDNQKHVVVLTKQREDEKDTYNSTVNRLKSKLAELKQQVGTQCVTIFLLKTFVTFNVFHIIITCTLQTIVTQFEYILIQFLYVVFKRYSFTLPIRL